MVDEIDIAQDMECLRLSLLLENRVREELPLIGMCHNCFEPLSATLFCDADCRDDYEKRVRGYR